MSPRSRQDLARVLLRRADGDLTLVRRVLDDSDIPDAIDRHAILGLVEEIRSWAGEAVER